MAHRGARPVSSVLASGCYLGVALYVHTLFGHTFGEGALFVRFGQVSILDRCLVLSFLDGCSVGVRGW